MIQSKFEVGQTFITGTNGEYYCNITSVDKEESLIRLEVSEARFGDRFEKEVSFSELVYLKMNPSEAKAIFGEIN